MEFLEKEYAPAKVKINYEELEAELGKRLNDYRGLVVTEDTLAAAKDAKKELASMRTTIDSYRKEKKKELEAPIKAFEEQCKKLIAMVQEAEKPLNEAIAVFDEKKREEKKKIAEGVIGQAIAKYGLYGKYAAGLTVLDKYMNLTATKKAVAEDIETRATMLKAEQNKEEERINTIKAVIESENARITSKLSIQDFAYMVNGSADIPTIIAEVKRRADQIYEAEHVQEKKVVEEEQKAEMEKAPVMGPVKEPEIKKELYTATYKITGTYAELKAVSNFLKEQRIAYEVIEQHKL